jgi:hypothetical protein
MFSSFFGGQSGADAEAEQSCRLILNEVRSYWEALRSPDGLPPLRSAVDPRGISAALEHAFIADRVAPGVARFRLAGAAICDLMGMDVRGMPMLSLIDPPDRAAFGPAMETALNAPAILEMTLEAERGIGRPALQGRLLMLPLRRADGGTGLSLGCLATIGTTGRAPRRFSIARRRLTPVDGMRQTRIAEAEPLRSMAEAPAFYTARPTAHPHLRLVKSDRQDD